MNKTAYPGGGLALFAFISRLANFFALLFRETFGAIGRTQADAPAGLATRSKTLFVGASPIVSSRGCKTGAPRNKESKKSKSQK